MSEPNRTKCPCCGAPTTLEHTPDSVNFKYAPDWSRVMDYNVQQLRVVAELITSYGITPADLRELTLNLEAAMTIARAEYEKMHQHVLEELRQRMTLEKPEITVLKEGAADAV